jgi:putative nucleotidyltransferase with HDIG domain
MKRALDLKQLIFNISSLVDLGQEVTSSSKGFNERMKTALYVVTGMFSVPKAALLLYSSKHRSLDLLASKGLREIHESTFTFQANRVKTYAMNEPYDVFALKKTPFYEGYRDMFTRLQTKTFIPLFARNEFVGAISLGKRLSRTSYLRSEKDVLKVIAHQLAITLHNSSLFAELSNKVHENKRLYEDMRRIYEETIQAFAAAIDAKDEYTKNHSFRVASYAVAIARELGWKEKDVEAIYVAGLLHDIGKIIIDRSVLNKGERLTTLERNEIKKHSQISYDILTKIKFPWANIADFVKHHHERVDGSGYPDSLMGTELSDGVKVLALADAFDAMTTDRPYRGKLSLIEAFNEVKKGAGTQFDSKIANVFFTLLQKEINGEMEGVGILPHVQSGGAFNLDRLNLRSDMYASRPDH